ncbi:hypothetical protein KCU93_g312, partial [Aureobasidium melanogenum]
MVPNNLLKIFPWNNNTLQHLFRDGYHRVWRQGPAVSTVVHALTSAMPYPVQPCVSASATGSPFRGPLLRSRKTFAALLHVEFWHLAHRVEGRVDLGSAKLSRCGNQRTAGRDRQHPVQITAARRGSPTEQLGKRPFSFVQRVVNMMGSSVRWRRVISCSPTYCRLGTWLKEPSGLVSFRSMNIRKGCRDQSCFCLLRKVLSQMEDREPTAGLGASRQYADDSTIDGGSIVIFSTNKAPLLTEHAGYLCNNVFLISFVQNQNARFLMASDLFDGHDGPGFCDRHGRRLDLDSGSHDRLCSSGPCLDLQLVGDDGRTDEKRQDQAGEEMQRWLSDGGQGRSRLHSMSLRAQVQVGSKDLSVKHDLEAVPDLHPAL